MGAAAYYNEIDPYAAQWLRNLIAAGHIAPGDVDERSIQDVHPDDLKPYNQCHFFAGIGVWSLTLRRAGWPDDRPVWTGSCPCQPFSSAGQGSGFDDERHLWPAFHWLIDQCRPAVVFGEQVASKAVDTWIDLVHADLEALGYAFAGIPFPSAGVGAPHIRDRLFWVADAERDEQRSRRGTRREDQARHESRVEPCRRGAAGGVGNTYSEPAGRDARAAHGEKDGDGAQHSNSDRPWYAGPALAGGVAHAERGRLHEQRGISREQEDARQRWDQSHNSSFAGRPGPTNGFWRDADWLSCRDGKWRPVEPGTFPLANGAPARVGRLRAYGNAINAEAATQFIAAYLEA